MSSSDEAAAEALRTYAGLEQKDAAEFVEKLKLAAADEAVEILAGAAPVPSNMTDARALRLRYISRVLGRKLTPREIEVIFRLTRSQASVVEGRMAALYPDEIEKFMRALVSGTAEAVPAGSADKGNLGYEISFDEEAAYDFAIQLLEREGMTHPLRKHPGKLSIEVREKMKDRYGNERDPITVLGVPVRKS
jgi:hypothetical protein